MQNTHRQVVILTTVTHFNANLIKQETLTVSLIFNLTRGVATGVDIGIYTPKISPSKLFMG